MPKPSRFIYTHRRRSYPTLPFVVQTHDIVLGSSPHALTGFNNESSVISAVRTPTHSAGGVDAYPTFFWKVAALGYGLIQGHGFHDGNKRTALLVMESTLEWNGEYTKWSQETKTLIVKLIGMGSAAGMTIEALRFCLLAACGYDVDEYDERAYL